jgi:parvulin-like peptidyl-prolyl isomerase
VLCAQAGLLRIRTPIAFAAVLCAALCASSGCKHDSTNSNPQPSPSASAPQALSPELASKVLAKVGDREITLGEYAATLGRMDPFERLRYQTPDRRRKLLDEIIKAELLAGEAKRRGLDKRPENQARIRQALRDEVLERARTNVPNLTDIPESEVRSYYEAHRDEFREPERRRVAHILLADEARAKKALEQALTADPVQWGKLVQEYSLDKSGASGPLAPAELAGDLGIVSGPNDARGDNTAVPAAVRTAVFQISKLGGVFPALVREGGRFHVVRLTGKTDARERSFAEAERSIRVALVQQKVNTAERELERRLLQQYPVKIDEAALAQVHVPKLNGAPDASDAEH